MYIDAKEIYQLVLEDVKKQVEQIKDSYGQQLCKKIEEDVSKLYEARIVELEKKNMSMQQQCTMLRNKIDELKIQNSEVSDKLVQQYKQEITRLKKKVKELEGEGTQKGDTQKGGTQKGGTHKYNPYSGIVRSEDDYIEQMMETQRKYEKALKAEWEREKAEREEENERKREEMRREMDRNLPFNGSSPCFITTAVCEYYGKEDDCEELTKLRHYRDTWLANTEGGKELIEEYYRCAPEIVRCIKASANYAEYCETLMNTYIAECLKMIDKGEFEACKNRYIEMVNYAKDLT